MKLTSFEKQVVIFLFAFLFCLNALCLRHMTLTYDETSHFTYGLRILRLNSDRFDDSKMPFSAFNAIPWRIGELLGVHNHPGKLKDLLINIHTGRYATIFFSLVLAYYVFRWAYELYGKKAAFFSLILYVFSPNILAHSQLVTVDLYIALTITVAVYYFWKFMNEQNWKTATRSALALGISQLAKYTAMYLYPIFLMIVFCRSVGSVRRAVFSSERQELRKGSVNFLKFTAYFILVNLLVINAGFLFNHSFMPLKKYSFKSEFFQSVQNRLRPLENMPVPVPYPFLQGLDGVKYLDKVGTTYGNIYLFGQLRGKGNNFKGFPGYYFYCVLFKEPIAMQIFFLMAVVLYFSKRKKYDFLRDELFFFVPVAFFTVYFNYFYNTQIGIRYFLMVFPFLHVFCGGLVDEWEKAARQFKIAIVTLTVYLIVSVLSYFPYYLPYFNELVWNRKKAYKILADSNIDWGQDEWHVAQYMKSHPHAYLNPPKPVSGEIVVGVNRLVGVIDDPKKYKWLRDHFEPVGHIGYAYLIYKIPATFLLNN